MKEKILSNLPTECPWRDTLYWHDVCVSTNDEAKRLAKSGAAHGTVIIAGHQTGGRGRMGRTFQSPSGGVYLSVILRPNCAPTELMHLTCAVGVAASSAVERAAGIRPGIKWINDLVWDSKKLGGILTEMSLDPKTGLVAYAIVGIGINCRKPSEGFPAQVQSLAVSLSEAANDEVASDALAAQMVYALWQMDRQLLASKKEIMDAYRTLCVTLGRQIMVIRGEDKCPGKAVDMDDDGGLVVLYEDGSRQTVCSGEVSVRGLWDYL